MYGFSKRVRFGIPRTGFNTSTEALLKWSLPNLNHRFAHGRTYFGLFFVFVFFVSLSVIVYTPTKSTTHERHIPFVSGKTLLASVKTAFDNSLHPSVKATDTSDDSLSMIGSDKPLKIAVAEHWGTHDEITAPLIAAFGSIPGVNITAVLLSARNRFGADGMYSKLKLDTGNPPPVSTQYETEWKKLFDDPPDFLVSATCSWEDVTNQRQLLISGNTHIFCMVHNSNWWALNQDGNNHLQDFWTPWIEADRLDFLVLSPHVATAFRTYLVQWKLLKKKSLLPRIHAFIPVFDLKQDEVSTSTSNERHFALQGFYDPTKRNYTRSFEELKELRNLIAVENRDVFPRLHLVGSGQRPEVPTPVQDLVSFDENLDYLSFYGVLSRMAAILPTFANPGYIHDRASSSVPAALIAGSPLVVNRTILSAYTYLDEDAVWLQQDGDTDLDTMTAITRTPAARIEEKRQNVRNLNARLVQKGKDDVKRWVNNVLVERQKRLEWYDAPV